MGKAKKSENEPKNNCWFIKTIGMIIILMATTDYTLNVVDHGLKRVLSFKHQYFHGEVHVQQEAKQETQQSNNQVDWIEATINNDQK